MTEIIAVVSALLPLIRSCWAGCVSPAASAGLWGSRHGGFGVAVRVLTLWHIICTTWWLFAIDRLE